MKLKCSRNERKTHEQFNFHSLNPSLQSFITDTALMCPILWHNSVYNFTPILQLFYECWESEKGKKSVLCVIKKIQICSICKHEIKKNSKFENSLAFKNYFFFGRQKEYDIFCLIGLKLEYQLELFLSSAKIKVRKKKVNFFGSCLVYVAMK